MQSNYSFCKYSKNDTNEFQNTWNSSLYKLFDIIEIVGNILSIILAILIIIFRKKYLKIRSDISVSLKESKKATFKKYWFHTFRNILLLSLITARCLACGEVFISLHYSTDSALSWWIRMIGPLNSLVGVICVQVLLEYLENFAGHQLYLLLPLFIWCLHLSSAVSRFFEITFRYCVSVLAVAPSLQLLIIAETILLVIIDGATLIRWVMRDRRKQSLTVNSTVDEKLAFADHTIRPAKFQAQKPPNPKTKKFFSFGTFKFKSFSFGSSESKVEFTPSGGENPPNVVKNGDIGVEKADEFIPEEKLRYCSKDISFLSKYTYKWYLKILKRGWQNPLEFSDLDSIPAEYRTKNQYEKFQANYELIKNSSPKGMPSLWGVFLRTYWKSIVYAGILKLFGDLMNVVGPLVIAPIVNFVKSVQEGTWKLNGEMHHEVYFVGWNEFILNGWILCLMAFVASILQSTFSQESTHLLTTEGINIRTALQSKVYEKTLRISLAASKQPKETVGDSGTGNIHSTEAARVINLTTEDTENIMKFFMHCHYLWAIPLKVTFLVALLYFEMGISAVIAIVISVMFLVPLQFLLGKSIKGVNKRILESCDERLAKTSEAISLIRALKTMALEELFLQRITQARGVELSLLLKDGMLRALLTFLTQASGIMIILLAFGFYSLLQDKLPDEGAIFSSLALFSQLTVALFLLPSIVQHTNKAVGSTKRLQIFFAEPEISPKFLASDVIQKGQIFSHYDEDTIVNIKNADFAYGAYVSDIVLTDITTSIDKGKLTMIVGGVGSGKSSLLLSLLGEVNTLSGSVTVASLSSNVAYVSQTPWLLNATLRENILMGRGFQSKKYKRVLGICALQPDIDALPDGDSSEIGERGVNISGGQKARICLARALYSDLPFIIMDCPFTALDVSIAGQVFQQIVNYHKKKGLFSTIVLATQHYHLCNSADKIIYLEKKTIAFEGTPQEISKSCPDLWDKLAVQSSKEDQNSSLHNLETFRRKDSIYVSNNVSQRALVSPQRSIVDDLDGSYVGVAPKRTFSLLHSSPLHALLPADEMESLSDPPLSRKKKSELPKNSLFRTTSSSPSFERFEDPTTGNSPFERRHARSLPSRPADTKDVVVEIPKENVVPKKSFKRKESIIKKLFPVPSIKRRKSMRIERRSTNANIWSLIWRKGSQITEEDETDSNDGDVEMAEDSDSIVCKAFIDEEERERGKISTWNYVAYLKACSWVLGSLYVVFMFANQGILITLDIWLGHWSEICQEGNCTMSITLNTQNCQKNSNSSFVNPKYNGIVKEELLKDSSLCWEIKETVGSSYLLTFAFLSGLAIFVGFFSICLNQLAAHKGRRVLHDRMLRAVVGTKVKFFDLNPAGRILNRFSSDMSLIDKEIGWSFMHFFYFALLCASAILVNSVVSPIFILVSIPVCLIYYVIQHIFRCSSRELKRLESLSLSPVLSLITETADYPPVIRAYGLQSRFFSCFCRRIDSYLSSSFLFHAGNRWLGINLDYMGCIIVFMSTLACLIGSTTEMATLLPPMTVGLAIKYTLTIPVYLNWLVRYLTSTEVCLNSVERVLQYTRLIPETELSTVQCCSKRKCRCRNSFKRGLNSVLKYDLEKHLLKRQEHLVFQNVDLYYDKNAEPVVKQVSFRIASGQKIGVCGRTGSGKSSILKGLLRMTDRQEGQILLNGFDIKKIPHSILRRQISVISQDICIFKDTIRFNVDPENKHIDVDIWNALEKVQMKDIVASLPNKINTVVGPGNLVLSAGQAQLLVLSRIFLDRRNLILLDEFAANLNTQLESELLSMIKQEASNSTVIMVTHNVESLLSCDRILSVDEGKLVEDGSPSELRNKRDGVFASLLRDNNN